MFIKGMILLSPLFFVGLIGCGGGDCGGTIFVNTSTTESVIVSTSSTSDIEFETFTLSPGEQKKVCGDDASAIGGDYLWPNGDTANLGQTSSSGDVCIFLTPAHSATSGSAGSC